MLGDMSHNVFACVHADKHIVSKLLLEKLSFLHKSGDGTNTAELRSAAEFCAVCSQTQQVAVN